MHALVEAYGGRGPHGVFSFLAVAVLWHVVGRLVRTLSVPYALAVGAVALGGLLYLRRGRAARRRSPERVS